MNDQEAEDPIKIYLDDAEEPFKVAEPPLRFSLTTIALADGEHRLRVEAPNGLAPPTIKEIPFRVRNGVAVTVSGLEPNQTIGGQVELIVNAYAGNTEVDFEPRRAETPQPIPTWAWVLSLAVLAWTMFYVFNPARPPRDAASKPFRVDRELGERLYMDTCARCHGEDGTGQRESGNPDNFIVKKLRNTPNLAISETPYKLLFKVVTGTRSTGEVQMPAWGPRLTNEEIVAVVNFVRTSWGHDASIIDPVHRQAPPGIDELEGNILDAMMGKDAKQLQICCWPDGVRPQLYRIDGPRWAVGRDDVVNEWTGYFEALGTGEVADFQLTDVRYAYEREAVSNIGAHVFAMGRIFQSTRAADGTEESDQGRFIRVYRRIKRPGATIPDGAPLGTEPPSMWALVFDFASIRMRVGCEVDPAEDCPPEDVPISADGIGYAEVQTFFRTLNKDHGDAPHEDFWELSYEKFVNFEFPPSWDDVDAKFIKLLEVGNSKDSNLIKALRDGRGLSVRDASGQVTRMDVDPMPKGGKMPDEEIAKIAAWIDAGCPEIANSGSGGGAKPPPKDGETKDDTKKDTEKKAATGSGSIGYADVQNIFKSLRRDPGDAGHEDFWNLDYDDFVGGDGFPYSWDNAEMRVKLVVPWRAKDSNLIKALKDGKGIVVNMPDGSTVRRNISRMPKGGAAVPAGDLQRIAAWIDAGCPKEAGGTSPWPKPGGAVKDEPEKADPKKDEPKKADPKKEPPNAKDGPKAPPKQPAKTSKLGYAEVIKLFKKLRQKAPNAPHSSFWRELSWKEFVEFEFPEGPGKEGMVVMLVPYSSAESNLIKALRDGKGLKITFPDGRVESRDIAPMPKDADPMPAADVQAIADWIDAGCPENAGQPSSLKRGGAAKAPAKNEAPKPQPASDFPAPKGGG